MRVPSALRFSTHLGHHFWRCHWGSATQSLPAMWPVQRLTTILTTISRGHVYATAGMFDGRKVGTASPRPCRSRISRAVCTPERITRNEPAPSWVQWPAR